MEDFPIEVNFKNKLRINVLKTSSLIVFFLKFIIESRKKYLKGIKKC
jgi:hypothetical protein